MLGKIIDSFGLDGTLKVFSTSSNEKKRYQSGRTVFLYDEENDSRTEFKVISYRNNGKFSFLKLEGINNEQTAKNYKGFEIQVIKDQKDLDEGYYFYSDLRGCKVIDDKGKEYGVIKEVEEFPAQITLRVSRKNGKDFFIPFIKDFILNVDINNKRITVKIIEGML